jgi:hypothetical protein
MLCRLSYPRPPRRNNVNGVDADDHFIGLLAERLKIRLDLGGKFPQAELVLVAPQAVGVLRELQL